MCFIPYSDDDLEPYDLTNDTKASKVKVPLYVRDCMEGKLDKVLLDPIVDVSPITFSVLLWIALTAYKSHKLG